VQYKPNPESRAVIGDTPGKQAGKMLIYLALWHTRMPPSGKCYGTEARLSKAPEAFQARKAIFCSSVCKNGEVYTPETCCMRWTSPHIKKM